MESRRSSARVAVNLVFDAEEITSTSNSGSHRFGADSAIGMFAAAVNAGDADVAMETLTETRSSEINFVDTRSSGARLKMVALVETLFASGARSKAPVERLQRLESARILCAVNHGAYGVHGLNLLAKSQLSNLGLIDDGGLEIYDSKPIIIPQNDYSVSLFNGDTGVIYKEGGKLMACFSGDDGRIRKLPLSAIKRHLPAYATTIHKSQGSEFDHVVVVLPDSFLRFPQLDMCFSPCNDLFSVERFGYVVKCPELHGPYGG